MTTKLICVLNIYHQMQGLMHNSHCLSLLPHQTLVRQTKGCLFLQIKFLQLIVLPLLSLKVKTRNLFVITKHIVSDFVQNNILRLYLFIFQYKLIAIFLKHCQLSFPKILEIEIMKGRDRPTISPLSRTPFSPD